MTTEITRGSGHEEVASGIVETVTEGANRASATGFQAFVRTATGSIPSGMATPKGPRDWRERYARALRITDFIVIAGVVFGTQLGWLGVHTQLEMPVQTWPGASSYTVLSCVIVVG
ncbi:MAG: hypothetical protein ACTJFP_11635, partial [Agrococcus casei]